MMTFFPTPYNDELLYSILARYCMYSGNTNNKTNLDDIYGIRSITSVMELPSHIDRIISNLPDDNEFSSGVRI